jgi:hypothetical protein
MEKAYLFALNGGEVSPLAMGRVDLTRMRISGETCLNVIPRVIGPMQGRPGTAFLGATTGQNPARNIPFVFSADDTALIELSNLAMRVRVNGSFVSREDVATTVINGDFSSATGWTTTTTNGGVSSIAGGKLTLQTPDRGGTALCKRSVSVDAGEVDIEHALEIDIERGPVTLRVGTTDGGDDLIRETPLRTGFHSLAFTPGVTTFYVRLSAESEATRVVDSIQIAGSGTMTLTTIWTEADLFSLRYDQSGDVIYITSSNGDRAPKRIERRGISSWSITDYDFGRGPFRGKTGEITLTPSSRTGNGTLTASSAFFTAGHVGCVFRIGHERTTVSSGLAGDGRFTDEIEISGAAAYVIGTGTGSAATGEREITVNVTGSYVGTVTVMTTEDDGVTWRETKDYPADNAVSNDKLSPGYLNTIVKVKAGFRSGNYTSGTADITIDYGGGGGDGYVLIKEVNSSTSATYEVVRRLHDVQETDDWEEGQFSTLRGHPTAVGLFEGRLWWGSDDKIFGSESDGFDSFDLTEEGDAGPIIRTVATGPVNSVRWLLGLARLCIGTSGAEPVGRSSSFDEPITPTNFSIKDASTQGSADIQAVKVDKSGIFIQRSGKRAYRLAYSVEDQDYAGVELTRFHPTILKENVKIMAVQRQPDTRIWFVLDDGTAAVLTFEPGEDVLSWWRLTTDGLIEDVAVLPNVEDDDVYFVVKRTVNGSDNRYVEKLAYDQQAEGGENNYMADSYIETTLSDSATVTGLSHLEAKEVVVWANGAAVMDGDDPQRFTVASGQITLPESVTGKVIVGLPYTWQWKSAKLAYGTKDEAPLSRRKRIHDIAPILLNTHSRGIKYGQDFTDMDHIPLTCSCSGAELTGNEVIVAYDNQSQALPGDWSTDARVCLQGTAPLPCTVLALSITVEGH